MKSKNENQLLWEQRFEERAKSGLSIAEWCKNNGINKGRYHYWKNQIHKSSNTNEENTFAEITTILSNTDVATQDLRSSFDFQIFFKGIQVTVPSNFEPASLTGLMKVLQVL